MKPNLLIRASAGSGKTRKLSLRYLELIVKGAPISTVLASTFTRKATGEILNRILLTAAQACYKEELLQELSENVGREISVAEMNDVMRRLVRGLNQIRACSLSSFFHRIALCFPYEMGLKPGWRILDDVEDADLRWNAIHETLAQNEQNTPALIRQLFKGESVNEMAKEIFDRMHDLLALENSASPEAWEAIQKLPKLGLLNEIEIVECLNRLDAEAEELEASGKKVKLMKTVRKIADQVRVNDWYTLVHETIILNTLTAGESEPIKYNRSVIDSENLISALRPLARHAVAFYYQLMQEQLSSVYTLVSGFAQNYNTAKASVNGLQFEDVTRLVADFVAKQNGNLQPLYWRMNAPVNHLLLDEFQDTSLDQWHIFQPFGERCTSGGENRSFFCVGDVKQAIYRWRNGRAEIFDAIEKTFPGIEQESSNMSWRSAPEILRCVNRFFLDPTKITPEDYGTTENSLPEPISSGNETVPIREFMPPQAALAWDGWRYEKHIPSPKSAKYPGYWELRTMPSKPSQKEFAEMMKGRSDYQETNDPSGSSYGSDSDDDSNSSYEPNDEYTPKREDVQWRWVAKQIAEHYRQWRGMYRIGVLFRDNKYISRLARFLREEGVAVSEEGKNPLTNSNAVCLVLSLLTLMDYPENSMSWFYVGNSALVSIYPELRWQDVKHMDASARENCLADLSSCLAKLREEFQAFGVSTFVEKLSFALQPFCTAEEERRLTQLRNLAANYGQNSRMRRIIHFVDYVLGFKMEDPSGASVTLMSIHGSKGLQFDAVFLPEIDFSITGRHKNFVAGYQNDDVLQEISLVTPYPSEKIRNALFPETSPFRHAMMLDERDRMRENFSLLYVAMTRAIHAMYLFIPPQKKRKPQEYKYFGSLLCMGLAGVEKTDVEELVAWDGDPKWYQKTAQALQKNINWKTEQDRLNTENDAEKDSDSEKMNSQSEMQSG
ncbi:MAG: UvrD-helicase domain-containing protein, partial [Planctomycetia bacterium]|nr:UvrD-helicase domain-containing protein [Planctomycetia bacterium]